MKHAFDAYETLQVVPDADPDVIRAAFRTLARKRHPDMGGSEEAMAVLNEAWSVLRDRHRRTLYDRERATAAAIRTAKTTAATPAPFAQPTWTEPTTSAAPGTVLDFGRYEGRTLADLAVRDPDYLEWLVRTRIGNRFRHEVDRLLATSRIATATGQPMRRSRFRRG